MISKKRPEVRMDNEEIATTVVNRYTIRRTWILQGLIFY